MPKIVLNLQSDLKANEETGQLELKISQESGNTLCVINDSEDGSENGIYAETHQGKDGSGGTGYDTQISEGIMVGYVGPFGNESPRRVSNTLYIHHVFEAGDEKGKSLKGFRPEIDYVLPGDMYIHNNNIYLVVSVKETGKDGKFGSPGNEVTGYIKIGEMPNADA